MKKILMMCVLGLSFSYGGIDNICLNNNDNFKSSMTKLNAGDRSALKDVLYWAKETSIACSKVTGKHQSIAEELVYYADMRVMHDKIVPLKCRLEDGHRRNTHLHAKR